MTVRSESEERPREGGRQEEVKAMCQHCNSDYSLWGLRDAAFFSCMWDGPLRCSEACGLDVADLRDTDDPDDLHVRLLRSLCRSCSYDPISRVRRAARGNRRWTGAPLFASRIGTAVWRNLHLRSAPRGGAPVSMIPGGKARTMGMAYK